MFDIFERDVFPDRTEAGRRLAERLRHFKDQQPVVLALPRGGVPVGFEVAHTLHAPLDVFVVRKLGTPHHEELAMGAIASGGVRVLNQRVIQTLRIPAAIVRHVAAHEERELGRCEQAYRGDCPPIDVRGKTVVLVDDGLATGSTMQAAVTALREQHPRRIVVAVPTAPADVCDAMRDVSDEVVCLSSPEPFLAVGVWYEDFSETTDADVRELLASSREWTAGTLRSRPRWNGKAKVGLPA